MAIKRKKRKDFWNDLSKNERKEIKNAIKDIDNGRFYSLDKVLSKHKKN